MDLFEHVIRFLVVIIAVAVVVVVVVVVVVGGGGGGGGGAGGAGCVDFLDVFVIFNTHLLNVLVLFATNVILI